MNFVTAPEIEMLIIINEGKYKDFSKSKLKPSEYCKIVLRMRNIKTYQFVCDYFSDYRKLEQTIMNYDTIHQKSRDFSLKDILK